MKNNEDSVPNDPGNKNDLDWKTFRKGFQDLKWHKILLFFLVLTFCFLISVKLEDGDTWISQSFSSFPHSKSAGFGVLLFLALSLSYAGRHLMDNLLPTPKSTVYGLSFIIFYVVLMRMSSSFSFYSFKQLGAPWLYYFDLIILGCTLFFAKYQGYSHPLHIKDPVLIEDHAHEGTIDEFYRGDYAHSIAQSIIGSSSHGAFNIGIFAEWGAGKTDFLMRLKMVLREKEGSENENIIVDFNPWLSGKTDILIDDFFQTLSEALKPYSRSIASKINGYSSQIFKPAKEIQFRVLDSLIAEVSGETSIRSRFNDINELILRTGKRIIVFIDDIDRLSGSEVFQVLKIIRNTANFSNTFFIVALDENYVVKALKSDGSINNESAYLKKIFQLSVTLPVINKNIFSKKIMEFLAYESMPDEDKYLIDVLLNYLEKATGFSDLMFDNLRDVKRFCNTFKISFGLLKKEVDVRDLAILELLKLNYIGVYHELASKRLMGGNWFGYKHELDLEVLKKYCTSQEIEIEKPEKILKQLFNPSNKNDRAFSNQENFYIYFSYQLFSMISLGKFNQIIVGSAQEITVVFNQWIEDGKIIDLERIMEKYPIDVDQDHLERFTEVFLTIGDVFLFQLENVLVKSAKKTMRHFGNSQRRYKSFLLKYLNNSALPLYTRASLLSGFLKKARYETDFKLFSVTELEKKISELFRIFLSESNGYNAAVEIFYRLNDDFGNRENRAIIHEQHNNLLRDYLLSDPNAFLEFIRISVRSYTVPNTENEFVLNPFLPQIFPDLNVFVDRLRMLDLQPSDQRFKRIIMDNIEGTAPNRLKKFVLSESDSRAVLGELTSLGLYRSDNQTDLLIDTD